MNLHNETRSLIGVVLILGLVASGGAAHGEAESKILSTARSATADDGSADSDPLVQFLTRSAVAAGVSPEVEILKNEQIMQLATLATEFELRGEESFVEARWSDVPETGAEMIFCAEPSERIRDEVSALPFEVSVVMNGGICKVDLQARLIGAMDAVDANPQVDFANGGYDPITGVVEIEYSAAEDLSTTLSQALYASTSYYGGTFELTYIGPDRVAEDQYRGGDSIGGCTAGFVIRNGPTFGISTAGHCSLSTNLYYSDGFFTSGGNLNKVYGDAQWHWSLSGTPYPSFRETTTSYVTATSVVTPLVGMGFCQYGKSSFTSCTSVYATNKCFTSGYGTVCGVAVGQAAGTAAGDSGGPVFSGSIAIGLHKGSFTYGGATRRVFTPVVNLSTGAGVSVYR